MNFRGLFLNAFRSAVSVSAMVICAACASPTVAPGASDVTSGIANANDQSVSADSYVLDQGDRISIQVFDEPDLTMESAIGASGVINYSYLGNVQVAGNTAHQLERMITGLLQDGYLVNPAVNVTVTEYRPFFINGEVRNPGSYPYQPGLTLDRAIALAGGLTDRASTRKIFVMKQGDAKQQYRAVMSTQISPGDIVSVKEGFF